LDTCVTRAKHRANDYKAGWNAWDELARRAGSYIRASEELEIEGPDFLKITGINIEIIS
jgi:hypothetical protein